MPASECSTKLTIIDMLDYGLCMTIIGTNRHFVHNVIDLGAHTDFIECHGSKEIETVAHRLTPFGRIHERLVLWLIWRAKSIGDWSSPPWQRRQPPLDAHCHANVWRAVPHFDTFDTTHRRTTVFCTITPLSIHPIISCTLYTITIQDLPYQVPWWIV